MIKVLFVSRDPQCSRLALFGQSSSVTKSEKKDAVHAKILNIYAKLKKKRVMRYLFFFVLIMSTFYYHFEKSEFPL